MPTFSLLSNPGKYIRNLTKILIILTTCQNFDMVYIGYNLNNLYNRVLHLSMELVFIGFICKMRFLLRARVYKMSKSNHPGQLRFFREALVKFKVQGWQRSVWCDEQRGHMIPCEIHRRRADQIWTLVPPTQNTVRSYLVNTKLPPLSTFYHIQNFPTHINS